MRRLLLPVLSAVLIYITFSAPAAAEAPLCALAPAFEQELLDSDITLGAAVFDLQTGVIWIGGYAGAYAMHSTIKAPVAWAVMTHAYDRDQELTAGQRAAILHMIAWSRNEDVESLLRVIGGLAEMQAYYERWGVPELSALLHHAQWGASRAEPQQLARLFAALANHDPDAVPLPVRVNGLDLLRAVVSEQRWGATIPERALPGWEALIKTGNHTIPPSQDQDAEAADSSDSLDAAGSNDAPDEAQEPDEPPEEREDEAGATLAPGEPSAARPLVRMNSAAIWLSPPWQGSQPRYVITLMQESFRTWPGSLEFQNRIGRLLAEAVVQREASVWALPSSSCLKRALA